MKVRKKPIEVEAVQWNGDNLEEIRVFAGVALREFLVDQHIEKQFCISSLEGDMKLSKMDWIIKGVNGEFYPCKPDIFDKTYDIL